MKLSTLFKYEFFNVLRGRWLIAYAVLFAGFGQALLQFGSSPAKAEASLMSVILLVVPLVSTLYSAVYWYGSQGFTILLMTQPIPRPRIYVARWLAISCALAAAQAAGLLVPLAINGALDAGSLLLPLVGSCLTVIFVAVGLFTSVREPDRMKGIGFAFLAWFYFAVVHDGLVFILLSALREYPIEGAAMFLTGINPIDLGRVAMLLHFDGSALMGYTGTVLQKALNGPLGVSLILPALALWVGLPVAWGARTFLRRDF